MRYLCIILFAVFGEVSLCAKDVPQIVVVGSTENDFGEYPAKERKEALFTIKNSGKGILKIKKVRKTCGCAEATMDKMELNSGETGILKVIVLPDSIYGAYRKHIYIQSNDPKQRFLTLTIAGKAIPIIKVKPKADIYAGTVSADKEWVQEFLLEATEKEVELGEISATGNCKEKTEIIKKGDEKFSLKVTITPAVKEAVFRCKIIIPIKNPKGWKSVEINITGKVKK